MRIVENRFRHRAALAALASALALGLAACGERPAGNQVGQNQPGNDRMDQASGNVEQRLEQAGRDIREKAAEAGKAVDDAALTAKVKSALISDPNLRAATINVDIMAGVVTLKGTTDSQENRKKATQVASAVEGVRDVKNELVVISG
jgi:hyperosmotically inducible protein